MRRFVEKFLYYFPCVIFNVAEMAIIFLCGLWLKIGWQYTSYIMLVFILFRFTIGEPKHYKLWQKCLLWSVLVFLSMFVVAKADFILSILMAIFCALILSGRANINDSFMFKPKGESNYKILIEYIKYKGTSDEFLKAEELLQKRVTPQEYLIFKRILIDGHTWEPIINEFGISPAIIQSALDKCYFFMIGRLNQ